MIKYLIIFAAAYLGIVLAEIQIRWWDKRSAKKKEIKEMLILRAANRSVATNFGEQFGEQWLAAKERAKCKHRNLIVTRGEPTLGDYIHCKKCLAYLYEDAFDNAATIEYR